MWIWTVLPCSRSKSPWMFLVAAPTSRWMAAIDAWIDACAARNGAPSGPGSFPIVRTMKSSPCRNRILIWSQVILMCSFAMPNTDDRRTVNLVQDPDTKAVMSLMFVLNLLMYGDHEVSQLFALALSLGPGIPNGLSNQFFPFPDGVPFRTASTIRVIARAPPASLAPGVSLDHSDAAPPACAAPPAAATPPLPKIPPSVPVTRNEMTFPPPILLRISAAPATSASGFATAGGSFATNPRKSDTTFSSSAPPLVRPGARAFSAPPMFVRNPPTAGLFLENHCMNLVMSSE